MQHIYMPQPPGGVNLPPTWFFRRLLHHRKRHHAGGVETVSPESELIIADIDIGGTSARPDENSNFAMSNIDSVTEIDCNISPPVFPGRMYRVFNPHPFVPSEEKRYESLSEVFNIQTHGLAKRLLHTGGIKKRQPSAFRVDWTQHSPCWLPSKHSISWVCHARILLVSLCPDSELPAAPMATQLN